MRQKRGREAGIKGRRENNPLPARRAVITPHCGVHSMCPNVKRRVGKPNLVRRFAGEKGYENQRPCGIRKDRFREQASKVNIQ